MRWLGFFVVYLLRFQFGESMVALKRSSFLFYLVLLVILLLTPNISWAWGTIQGVVRNNVGVEISSALVKTDFVTVLTWRDGSFQMLHPPGVYTITVTASGYLPQGGSVTVTDGAITTLPDYSPDPSPCPQNRGGIPKSWGNGE